MPDRVPWETWAALQGRWALTLPTGWGGTADRVDLVTVQADGHGVLRGGKTCTRPRTLKITSPGCPPKMTTAAGQAAASVNPPVGYSSGQLLRLNAAASSILM